MEEKVKDIISDEQQEYVINMGPQHPSTHGVLRLVVSLKGEVVKNIEPHIGYIHRGIEKMCESITYPQIIHLTDRMDYLSAHINNEAVCLNGMFLSPVLYSSKLSSAFFSGKYFSFRSLASITVIGKPVY